MPSINQVCHLIPWKGSSTGHFSLLSQGPGTKGIYLFAAENVELTSIRKQRNELFTLDPEAPGLA